LFCLKHLGKPLERSKWLVGVISKDDASRAVVAPLPSPYVSYYLTLE